LNLNIGGQEVITAKHKVALKLCQPSRLSSSSTPNDRNLEFDPKGNLLTNLEYEERANEP
jgi:hypothetical protein